MTELRRRQRSRIATFGLLLIVGLSQHLSAQQCPTLRFIVTPVDGTSGYMAGLTPENIRMRTANRQLKVIASSPHEGSQRVVLVLDFSDSMRRFWSNREKARLVLDNFVDSTPSSVAVGAVVFAKDIKTIFPTVDRELFKKRLTEAIQSVTEPKWRASSPIFNAVSQAGKLLGPSQTGDTLYLITDGVDTGSKATLGSLKKELSGKARLFMFLSVDLDATDPEEIAGPGYLGDLATFTGGYTFGVPAAGQLKKTTYESRLLAFFRNMREFYVVEIEEDPATLGDSRLTVEVVDANSQRRPNVTVFVSPSLECGSNQ